ncbi:MAG: BspA family leucine-rich repeat surface protein, partial [Treponema sp.]|nr:BspA family leucine-rich repeat surface protein [Treponema sp.]
MASRPGSRGAAFLCLLAAALLLTSCPGNGGATGTFDDESGETYAGPSSSGSGGSSSAGFSFDDFINLSNSGNTDALVAMFRDDSASSDGGPEGGEYGMDTLVMSATDIGVPAGGKVMLSISGGDADYEEETEVSDDGMVYFQIPRQRVGSRITVSIAVKRADGSIVRSGSKTMLVTDGCQFSVTLINGSPVVLPARLKSASSINSILTSLGAGSGGAARSFSPSLTPPPEGTTTYELSSSGSGVQVLAWLDGETIRYYADGMDACGIVPLPASSNSMFAGCSSLTSIDMSGFDASGVADMTSMFSGCGSLTSVNLSGWDTHWVYDMSCMFSHCSNLRSVDLSGWDTSRVSNMQNMFA